MDRVAAGSIGGGRRGRQMDGPSLMGQYKLVRQYPARLDPVGVIAQGDRHQEEACED